MLSSFIVAAALGAPADPASPVATVAQPRYFFILYGGQSLPFKPRTAHTWATFVRTAHDPAGVLHVELFTISWLPVTGEVKPWRLRPEPGRNYSLEETFAIAAANKDRVSMWGPFEIDETRYQMAVAQLDFLQSGEVLYRAIDSFTRNRYIVHCVHAVTYADPILQQIVQPVLQVGEPGTSRLAARYVRSGAFIGGAVTHDWVLTATGTDQFPVIRRIPGERIRREWR